MNWKKIVSLLYLILSAIGILALCLMSEKSLAKEKPSQIKTVPCTSNKNVVMISTKRLTALSFLEAPKEVVPGDSSFDFKRVQNDVFIKALSSSSRTNVFVFVGKKRCRFDLVASERGTDDLLEVREATENVMEVQFK